MNTRMMMMKMTTMSMMLMLMLKKKTTTTLVLAAGLLTGASVAQAPAVVPANELLQAQAKSGAASRTETLYGEGTAALNEKHWDVAEQKFDEVSRSRSNRAEGALYWKAFAQYKAGRYEGSLTTIAALRKAYPQSRWLNDAAALEIEMRGNDSAQPPQTPRTPVPPVPPVPPRDGGRGGHGTSDEDLKLLALNKVMERDPERALPLVQRFLQESTSERLKEHALFVLSQSDSPKAHELLAEVARGKQYPQLQMKAINLMGVVEGGPENMEALATIYSSSNDPRVKRAILNTFGVSGERERLVAIARKEQDADVQREAIQGLGISGARTELRQLYKELNSQSARMAILEAFIVADDEQSFAEIARTEADPKLRRKAIQGIGISGGRNAAPALVAIYEAQPDKATRRQVIEALFISDNAHALIELAKKEADPELKRDLVEKLSLMDSKEATDYMMQILDSK